MGFFKSQFWQASWIWQQVSVVCVCVQLILLHLLLLFITCLVICLYLWCVVFLPTHPSLPSPFSVQLNSKLLLCDVWEWWVWFFPWRFWFLSFWCFVDFFANNFWISPYNCWSKYEHSFGRLRDNFHIRTSPSFSQMELHSIWVVAMAWNLWRSKTCAWYEYIFASSAPPDYLADDIHVCKLCFPSLQMIRVGCWSTSGAMECITGSGVGGCFVRLHM